jgi:Na+:H+ antiporter, NhaA family
MKLPLEKPRSALREFLDSEASGGLMLMAAAALALIAANSPVAPLYFGWRDLVIGPMSMLHWIDDALMAVFFLLVGLEIKREFVDGHLSTWADRRLPVIAAAAGMAVPALVYLAVSGGDMSLARGWAIPAATDIAFAIGVLALLGSRAPASLKLFLTTVAIVDDMGAVAIIAIAYTASISGAALLAALAIMAVLGAMNRSGVVRPLWYVLGFIALWLAVHASGVHATVAGVLAAMFVPVRVTKAAPDAEDSTLHKMEHALQKPVAWAIVPLFGFANAGVALGGASPFAPLPLAIALGLFFGKQIGIFGSVCLAVKSGIAAKPAGASWTQVYGVALLCGIGFTMSLFIGGLAFTDVALSDGVKIGVLAGSLMSALAGWGVLRLAGRRG